LTLVSDGTSTGGKIGLKIILFPPAIIALSIANLDFNIRDSEATLG